MTRLILFVLFCWHSALSADVLFISDNGFLIQNKITVETTRAEAWKVFTTKIDKWWPKDHTWWGEKGLLTLDDFAGGCFCEKADTNSAEHMRVSFVEQHKKLVMTGGLGPLQGMGMFGALTWSFEDIEGKTDITMRYQVTGIDPGGYQTLAPIVDKVQAMQLRGLLEYLKN